MLAGIDPLLIVILQGTRMLMANSGFFPLYAGARFAELAVIADRAPPGVVWSFRLQTCRCERDVGRCYAHALEVESLPFRRYPIGIG